MVLARLNSVRLDADEIVNLVMASASGCGSALDTLLQEAYTLTVLDRRPFTEAVEDSDDRLRNARNLFSMFGLSPGAAKALEGKGMRSVTLLSLAGVERAASVVGGTGHSEIEESEELLDEIRADKSDDVSRTSRLFAELSLHPLEPLWSLKRLMARKRESGKEVALGSCGNLDTSRCSYLYFMDIERPKSRALVPTLPIGSFLGLMDAMKQLLKTPTLTTFYPDPNDMAPKGIEDDGKQASQSTPNPLKNGKVRKALHGGGSFPAGKRRVALARCVACGRNMTANQERSARHCNQCSADPERARGSQKLHVQQRRTFYNGQYRPGQGRSPGTLSPAKCHSPVKAATAIRYALPPHNRRSKLGAGSPEASESWHLPPKSNLSASCPYPMCNYVCTLQQLSSHVLRTHAFVPPMPIDALFGGSAYVNLQRKNEAILQAHFDTMWLTMASPSTKSSLATHCLEPVQFSFDGIHFFLMVSRDCSNAKTRSPASDSNALSTGSKILFWLWAVTKPHQASAFHFELMFFSDDGSGCLNYCPLAMKGRAISVVHSFDEVKARSKAKTYFGQVLSIDETRFHNLFGHGDVKYQLRIYTFRKSERFGHSR